MQHEEFFTRIREGLDVVDMSGEKVGTVGKVYPRVGAAMPGASQYDQSGSMAPETGSCIRIDTGFLGLGKDLYVPSSAITEVTADEVLLNVDKDRVDDMGWDNKPSYIED